MTAKDCLYNIPDETRFVNIFFRANGIKWREIFGRQRYSENVRQVTAPAVELQRPTRPLIRLLNRNKPFPTELFIIGSRQCKRSVGRDALITPWRNLYRLWQALQMICRIRCSHRAVAAHQTIPANSARLLRADDKHLPLQTKSRYCPTIIYSYIHPVLLRTNLPGVYLKNRNYRLFLQTQPDFALKSLGIRKGFQGSLPYILLVFAKYPSFSLFSDTP